MRSWAQTELQDTLPARLRFHCVQVLCCCLFLFPALATLVLSWFWGQIYKFFLSPPPLSLTGALLLAVHFYSLPRAAPLIPSTALGVLLLVLSSLLAYAGKTQGVASFKASPCYSFAHTWSAFPQGCKYLSSLVTTPIHSVSRVCQHSRFFLYRQPKRSMLVLTKCFTSISKSFNILNTCFL